MDGLTHASFFSGVGGLDMGLERAGWRTVSFSEIDPYASAVLAQRWPDVPNLGSITELTNVGESRDRPDSAELDDRRERDGRASGLPSDTRAAALWSGGFPCQDLSVAGKRRGMVEGSRSGLAYAFLDLVERHRPPAVLLENVPGLLSSHGGRDLGSLVGTLGQLGYGWAYRVLDARHFGVPQRRRRVFILGIHARIDPSGQRAAEVLSVGTRCGRHPATGHETGEGVAAGADDGADIVGTVPAGLGHHGNGGHSSQAVNSGHVIAANAPDDARGQAGWRQGSAAVGGREPDPGDGQRADAIQRAERPSSDPDRDGAPDGLAGRPHHRDGVASALDSHQGGADGNEAQAGHLVTVYARGSRPHSSEEAEQWNEAELANNVNGWDLRHAEGNELVVGGGAATDDGLPLGLDSHRYRCCGNGVVSNVAEWIGIQLAKALA